MNTVIKLLVSINVVLICGLIPFYISQNMTLPDATKQLQDEKIRLEIEKLRYELSIYKEQEKNNVNTD